jgi:ATP-dependent Clp protease ATP-binding subunit ClpC
MDLPSFDPLAYPNLSALGRNLSEAALQGRLDPLIGRDREVEAVVDILGKRRGNNPVLVGEPGVGKTAIAEGVAQRLLELQQDRVVIELEISQLIAGTSLRGAFAERLEAIKDEVRKADGQIVLFIDEIHTLVGAGAAGDGAQDAANGLKTALARGELPCIGATTHEEWRKFIEADAALERRLTPVSIEEPTIEQALHILQGLAGRYASHHRVLYTEEALEAAVVLSAKHVHDRQLPDKAIQVIDLAGSRAQRRNQRAVDVEEIAHVVADLARIPAMHLLRGDAERLLRLEDDLGARVVGHEETIRDIARALRRNFAGFASRRPMGSFLFLGPTGVGKTELAKALAEVLFGSERALIRFDMSELSEAHGVARLVGAPPGYVGYGEGGLLTEAVRRRPASVSLFDELEKAHRDVWMLLLQVLDEGRLTDGNGRRIDFSQSVVVLASNLGAEAFEGGAGRMGFGAARGGMERERAVELAKARIPPELWNRIDERCLFPPLERADVARIAALLLRESAHRLSAERRIDVAFDTEVIELLLDEGGFDPKLGARPMRRAIQRLVEAPLAEAILRGEILEGASVRAAVHEDGIAFL